MRKKGVCMVCACTEADACEGGCSWVNLKQTLCSSCAPLSEDERKLKQLQALARLVQMLQLVHGFKQELGLRLAVLQPDRVRNDGGDMSDDRKFPDETPELAAVVPDHLLDGLRRYGHDHEPVGAFLTACLQNDLAGAVHRADVRSLQALPQIVLFIYNAMPSRCHGSPAAVAAWLAEKASQE